MRRFCSLLVFVSLGLLSLAAQTVPVNGWSSFGVLPFHGYDFIIVQAPKQYILYYTQLAADGTEGPTNPPGRAFSTDLKNWTVDPKDVCATSGDLCRISSHGRSGVLTLPDGRLRLFENNGGSLVSMISSDGIAWTLESGIRFTQDSSSIYERGQYALSFASFVPLPDGSVRMYYEGGVLPGSAGTPAYYTSTNSALYSGMILSARSTDGGLTWVRDPGLRINPMVQGPVTTIPVPGGGIMDQFACDDVTAVALSENGGTVYRIFCPAIEDGAVSYTSTDGLSFVLEGQIPADQGDPKAIVMPDGRIWLLTNQYPDGIVDTLVYGPQSLFLSSVKAGVSSNTNGGLGPANPFVSAMMGITGTANGPVSLEAVTALDLCSNPLCPFHPEYYSFSPANGNPPFSTIVSYTGPPGYGATQLVVHASAANVTAAGAIYCMALVEGGTGSDVFCNKPTIALPLNSMRFGFSSGAGPSSQISSILALGGHGYPFTVSSSVPWATVSPASGTAPSAITVTANPAGLTPGTYTGVVTISAETTTEQINVTAVVSGGPVITSVVNAASAAAAIAPNSFVTIYGSGFAASPTSWSPTTSLPTSLGSIQVTINGKNAFISYAGPGQLNVLAPPDTASGTVQVQVTTAAGTATANVTMAPVSPGWFTYTVGSANTVAALYANTATYVAPSGSLGSQPARSAKAGDYLQLYVNGLGSTSPTAPPGAVLTTSYPLDNSSRVMVTIAGRPVAVQFAGLVAAGLYQVNVQVPPGLGLGDLPVVLMVDGQPTQGATLNFSGQ